MNWVRIVFLSWLSVVLTFGQIPINSGSFLGVGLADLDAGRAKELNLDPDRGGVEITRVQVNSPAGKVGLRPGDVLLTYNGENILGGLQLSRLVSETPPGRRVSLQFWRDTKMQTTVLVTARRTLEPDQQPHLPFPPNMLSMPSEIPAPVLVWKSTILGVECETLDSQLAGFFGVQHGVLIRYVEKGSPGEGAGIRAGDIIVAADDHLIATPHDLTLALRSEGGSRKAVHLSGLRDHKHVSIDVQVGE
jgi:serine protease Do